MNKSHLTVLSSVRRFLPRLMVVLAISWGGDITLFSVAPVSFSTAMVGRQVSAWLHGNFRYVAHSDRVNMDQISSWMGLAVIAAGDQKFPEHWGFDVTSIEQTLAHSECNENRIHGASTISQQAAKDLSLWGRRNWVQRGLKAGLALGIETVWNRKRILMVYLNTIEFGGGVFDVEAAARRYFRKPTGRLTRSETALLAAVLPNPLHSRVSTPSGYVRSRQAWILWQMYQLGGESFMQQHQLD